MEPEAIYAGLKELASSVPDLRRRPFDSSDVTAALWLGRLSALAAQQGSMVESLEVKTLTKALMSMGQESAASQIFLLLYRALARAELQAPVTSRGAFIAVGNPFDAIASIGKILGGARSSVRIIDPYLSERVLTDFAPMAGEGVAIELLADTAAVKPGLKPAAQAWVTQYGVSRPLQHRLAPARALHDRLIFVDGVEVWDLSQSIKDFAARSPASATKADAELATMKIGAYQAIWDQAVVVL